MNNNSKLRKAVFLGIFLISGLKIFAQDQLSVRIEMIESRNFPYMEAIIDIEDGKGEPILSMVKSNIKVTVDLDKTINQISLDRFAATERPINYYVLMTNSGLTRGQPLAMQKEAVLNIVDSMKPKDSITVFTVGLEPVSIIETTNKEKFDKAILDELDITEKQSKLYDSLIGISRVIKEDMKKRSISNNRTVLILLTDGRDQESRSAFEDVVSEYDINVAIYSIGIRLLGAQSLSSINSLSDRTGGHYFYSPDVEQVPYRMKAILNMISSSYLLSFNVTGVTADDDRHQIKIAVEDKGMSDEAYKTFIAVKVPFPFWLRVVLIIIAVLLIAAFIVLTLLSRRRERKALGIGKRRCDDCGRRLRDDWEFCPFCRYLKKDKKRKKKKKDGDAK
ncbi:MAG: VWA domain-containing protein [Spirochaetales bacterium]|nr:VWA domain-containing protein [Spirochaetales bacterium]